ncbi:hypothetical protein A6I84_19765 [Prescottella equi]|nr:hypothetical protein A6I84_19765 [Prescottella equi]
MTRAESTPSSHAVGTRGRTSAVASRDRVGGANTPVSTPAVAAVPTVTVVIAACAVRPGRLRARSTSDPTPGIRT